jgi:polyphenol oxidase
MLIRPKIFQKFPYLAAAQSTRHGGISKSPYNSLNLGKYVQDDPEDVFKNQERFCLALGFKREQLAIVHQVHGDLIKHVEKQDVTRFENVSRLEQSEDFDALMSNQKGILLAVGIADCTPILVFDAKNEAFAAIHAGWRGTVLQIVRKTLEAMNANFGTNATDCYAYIGACIDECSFEVGNEVAAEFSSDFKRFDANKGKYFVDLKRANAAQLYDFGVPKNQVEISPFCTVVEHETFFSHRADNGITGRGMAAIGIF